MKKYLCFVFFLCACLSGTYSQTAVYASEKLGEIADLLPKGCLPEVDSVFGCPKVLKSKMLVINYNTHHEVVHLGISLFSPEAKDIMNPAICNFIERLMLELVLQKNEHEAVKRMQEYQISIEEYGMGYQAPVNNVIKMLNEVEETIRFSLQQETYYYTASWHFDANRHISMRFPSSRELVFGTNKRESDADLNTLLSQNRCEQMQDTLFRFSADQMEAMPESDFYVRRSGYYDIPEINGNIYCIKNEQDIYVPVYDTLYPQISLRNLLLTNLITNSLYICIQHCGYDHFTPEFEIKLSDFVCFFQDDYDAYCAVEQKEAGTLDATLILRHKALNYIHLLTATVPVRTVFQENGIFRAELYSNIPQHNTKPLVDKRNQLK